MGWEMGESFKREGTYVHLWLIHVNVWQKPIQLKKKKKNQKTLLRISGLSNG